MSNLSKTQLSFEYLRFSQSHFVELFNGLSTRDKNNFRNSQCGTEMNEMFDFLCGVLGKKVVDEKKARKAKPKQTETTVVEEQQQLESTVVETKVESSVQQHVEQSVEQTLEKDKKQAKKPSKKQTTTTNTTSNQ